VNESTIVVIVCVSFLNVIPKLSGRMDFGNEDYGPVSTPAIRYAHCIGFGAFHALFYLWLLCLEPLLPRTITARHSIGMPRFGDMNRRSFGAKLNLRAR
jgi:hypothetical protein